jgi:hypothetical protein
MLHWSHDGRPIKLGDTMAGIRIFLLGSKDGRPLAGKVDVLNVSNPEECYRLITASILAAGV